MKITRLELIDYKCFEHLVLDNLGDRVVLVGPNGCGKSTILEAIAIVKEYVSTYDPNANIYKRSIPLANKSHTAAWHPNLALPIRAEQPSATVVLNLELNEAESKVVDGLTEITASIHIDRSYEVTTQVSDPKIIELFRRYEPGSGIGIFDYISPQRQFMAQQLTNLDMNSLSIDQQRRERIELPNPGVATVKFDSVKKFIIGQQVGDTSIYNDTGEERNSIKPLQDLFAFFFGPKRLIGAIQKGNEFQVVVDTPSGRHDIDQLSSGEKELFNIFTSLFRIRDFPAVILYDEPERHLNPGLESRIIPALAQLQTQNQLWIATHATELIDSVPLQEIIALPRLGGGQPRRFLEAPKTERVRLFEQVGATVGLQLASNRIVFLEGKDSSSDKRIIERLAGSMLPGVLFIPSGSSMDVQGSATRASLLIEKASEETAFMMALDRDYRDEESVKELAKRLNNRVFIWSCHEVENLLLNPEVILEVLQINGCSDSLSSPEAVEQALLTTASSLAERFAVEWAAYRLTTVTDAPERIRPKDQVSYYKMVRARGENSSKAYSEERARTEFEAAVTSVKECLSNGSWLEVLPGKEILNGFRGKHLHGLREDKFRSQIVEFMLRKHIELPEIERLCEFINKA